MAEHTFFTRDTASRYLPAPRAFSLWGPDALNGPAVCAVAAHAVETGHTRAGWRPARFTIELFKAARGLPTEVRTRVARSGGRILVIDFDVLQDDPESREVLVASGVTVFLREGTNPPGSRWSRPAAELTFAAPIVDDTDAHPRFGGDAGWTSTMADMQHAERKRMWSAPIPVAPDSPLTAFQRAVIGGESASLMTNWGEGGIGFINCDLTVAIARLPRGTRIGIEADSHWEADGISIGTASLYDEAGPFGSAAVTAVENSRAMIDFATLTPPIWTDQA
ncbi:MAG: acyl-CoA thioesterase domain-containing protein [Gordonia sp. (in: high G+C Gram-positive bacteria)]|uniref:acyl-CoA thioesterase domain-containing protein n=1 Tax=Gordonia sp. (in: high G+C Gram-positive bacteria) TaxID=84139 RepID=UPI003BB790EA